MTFFQQGISIACYTEPCISYGRHVRPSVRPSDCLSVTCWHCVKMTQAREITKSSRFLTLQWLKDSSIADTKFIHKFDSLHRARALNETGVGNLRFSANKSPYLRNVARYDQCYYKWLIESRIRAFNWCQNHRPWMTLNGRYALYCRKYALAYAWIRNRGVLWYPSVSLFILLVPPTPPSSNSSTYFLIPFSPSLGPPLITVFISPFTRM